MPSLVWVCETWIIFGSTFLAASYIPNVSPPPLCQPFSPLAAFQVGYVWNFVGSIGGTVLLYIFPSAAFLRLRYKRHIARRKPQRRYSSICKDFVAIAILIVGLCLLVVENYSSVIDIINAGHDPSSLCSQLACVTNSSVFTA